MRTSTSTLTTVAAALLSALALVACGESGRANEPGLPQLALTNLPPAGGAQLTVTSPAFLPGGDIPFENTQYRGNVFPGLSWTPGPASTQSYVVIMQDTDAMVRGAPILHWTMINIPATVTTLEAGMTTPPAGAQHGPNIRGANQGYLGPRTPAGPRHHYHFQVFALDTTIDASKANTYDDLIAAMKGHVVASGEVVGLGRMAPSD